MNDPTPDYLLDIDLAAAIAAALNLQLSGSSGGVTVSVSNGVVTLEGAVAVSEERERAERIVRTFTVAGVVNAIAVAERTLSRDGHSAKRQKPLKFAGDPPVSG